MEEVMEKLTKAQTIRYLAEKNDITLALAERVLDSFLVLVLSEVEQKGYYRIAPLGVFRKKAAKATTKVNPKVSGGMVRVPAKKTVKFRASETFRLLVNGGVMPKGTLFNPADDRARELDLETEDL
jgi:nucleoid DNA-binding protein